MALVTCSECGKEFSEHAECCPNCGCPVDVIREQIELANIKKEPETIEFAKHFKCEKCGCTEFNPMIATTCVIAQCANCGIATFNNVIRKLTPSEKVAVNAKLKREIEAQKPHCPFCNSTNLKKIGAGSRLLSVGTLGLAGAKMGKTYHCNNCKANF